MKTQIDFDIDQHVIFEVLVGSRAYGLATEESDYDYRGVVVPPQRYFFGFASRFEQYQSEVPDDRVLYDVRKFFKLIAEGNPNLTEMLWVPDSCLKTITGVGERIFLNRGLFISTRFKHRLVGYADEQVKLIQRHLKWMKQAPLPHTPEWRFYQQWLENRTTRRYGAEKKFGYDTKNGMHIVRLLRMCEELLKTGALNVVRKDREELLSILHGAWTFEHLIEWVAHQKQKLDVLYRSCDLLPRSIDMNKVDVLCQEIVEEFFGYRKRTWL